MALQTIIGGIWTDDPSDLDILWSNGSLSNTHTWDAGTDSFAQVFRFPLGGSCTKVAFRTKTKTTFPTNGMLVQLETIDATTGAPTGTLYHANATATLATGAWAANTWTTVTWASAFTVTKNAQVALVIKPANSGDAVSLQAGFPQTRTTNQGNWPYVIQNLTGSYAKNANGVPLFTIEIAGAWQHVAGVSPTPDVTLESIASPVKRGNRYSFPVPLRVAGAWVMVYTMPTNGAFNLQLYLGNSSTPIPGATFTPAWDDDIAAFTLDTTVSGLFDTPAPLDANTVYNLVIEPSSVTIVRPTWRAVSVAAEMDALVLGQSCYRVVWNAGTSVFDATMTGRYIMGLILDQFDDGVRPTYAMGV